MKREPAGNQARGRLGPRPVPQALRRGSDLAPRPAIEIYGWQFRGKPVSVKIAIDLIARLQADIEHGLNMSAPCDVCGLLIGRLVTEAGPTFVVDDYELAGYARESASAPFGSDERLVEMVKGWSKRDGPRQVVGFFRSQQRGWPAIDQDESKAAKRLLRRTQNIFLVIRSAVDGDYTGVLFLRQGRSETVEEGHGEFPFNADVLRAGSRTPPLQPQQIPPSQPLPLQSQDPLPPPPFVPGKLAQETERADTPGLVADVAPVESIVQPVLPLGDDSAELPVPASSVTAAVPEERLEAGSRIPTPPAEPVKATLPAEPASTNIPSGAPKLNLPPKPAKQSFWIRLLRSVAKEKPPSKAGGSSVASEVTEGATVLIAAAAASAPLPVAFKIGEACAQEAPLVEPSERLPKSDVAQPTPDASSIPSPSTSNEPPQDEPTGSPIENVAARESSKPAAKWSGVRGKPIELFADPTPSPERASSYSYQPKPDQSAAEDAPQNQVPAAASQPGQGRPRFPTSLTHPLNSWRSWLPIAATWAIAVGVTMWFMDGRSLFRSNRATVAEAPTVTISNPLGLEVNSRGDLLEIAWDRASSTAMNSQGGFLTIRDGKLVEAIQLNSLEIKTGHVYYEPRSTDLGIRLELAQGDGGPTAESIRVIGPPAPPTRRFDR